MDRPFDQQPRPGQAGLPGVSPRGGRGADGGGMEVGVGEDDVGTLTPSSRVTRFNVDAAAAPMSRPVSVEPVNATLSTPG